MVLLLGLKISFYMMCFITLNLRTAGNISIRTEQSKLFFPSGLRYQSRNVTFE